MNEIVNKRVEYSELGLMPYEMALNLQTQAFNHIVETKIFNRTQEKGQTKTTNNYLFFCEHPHVYTLGRSGSMEHLLIAENELPRFDAVFYKSSRGGDITYHGPGQLVVYPVLDLDNFFTDIHKYMRTLEEAVIQTLLEFGIECGRIAGLTGVWTNCNQPEKSRKICAFGVKTSRWVTMHGLSLNVNTDLSYFNHIVPCGINDKSVTSMQQELQKEIDMHLVRHSLRAHLSSLFDMSLKF